MRFHSRWDSAIKKQQEIAFLLLAIRLSRILGLIVQGIPGIIVVRREHMAGLQTAGEVVMAVEIPVAVNLNKPGASAGATGHIAGNRNHRATRVIIPKCAGSILAGLTGLAIERVTCGITIGGEGLSDLLIIGPTGTADHVGQIPLTIGINDSHAKVAVQVNEASVYPVGRNL